jgi:hypothetical protein
VPQEGGPIQIQAQPGVILLGILFGVWASMQITSNLVPPRSGTTYVVILIGALLGGRAGYLLLRGYGPPRK